MRFQSLAIRAVFVTLASLLPALATGQATILVDPTDPVYRDIAQLVSLRLVNRAVLGQRPYSRAEVIRIAAAAERNLEQRMRALRSPESRRDTREASEQHLAFIRELVESIRERFPVDSLIPPEPDRGNALRVEPMRSIHADFTRVTAPTRPVPRSNGLGEIDAVLNPMIANRRGRPLSAGSNFILGMEHLLESQYVALFAAPELYIRPRHKSAAVVVGRLQELQVRVVFKNLALDVGRESLVWGQGREVGLLLSNNSPPLDLVKLSNERLLTLPWVFRRLGPTKISLFYADLGAAQNFPHASLVAYKLSVTPTAQLEIGASVFTKFGGRGSPPASWSTRILDLFPFLDAGNYANIIGVRGKFEGSDKYAGLDGRLRWPSAGGTELYWELLLNDFDIRRLGSVLWEDAGHVVGLSLPKINASGRAAASIEFHHTGIRYYRHEQFTSGQTLRGTLIGDPLGPDAQGAYLNMDWYASPRHRFAVQGALERRSNDQYEFLPVALPAFGFRRVASQPKEQRLRATATWRVLPRAGDLGLLAQAGLERTHNFAFLANDDQTGFLGRLAVQYRWR